MKITLDEIIKLKPESSLEFEIIKEVIENNSIFKNPKYYSNEKLGFTNKGIPRLLKLYSYNKINKEFEISKAAFNIIDLIILEGVAVTKTTDNRVEGKEIDFKCNFEARGEQQKEAIELYKDTNFGYGLLNAICGLTKPTRPTINTVNSGNPHTRRSLSNSQ